MSLTLNQIVKRLETLALSHDQINSFGHGFNVVDFIKDADKDYASIYALFSPTFNINRSEHLTKIPITFYFMDMVNVSEDTKGNETEVYSDMLSVAQDFKAMLESSTYQDDWEITEDNSAQFLFEEFDDILAGVAVEITISVQYASDRCQVPATDVTFETDSNDMRTYDAAYTADGTEGNTLTIADIFPGAVGKNIIFLTREAVPLKKVTSGVPTVRDYLFSATEIEFLYDLSADERIFILYRNNN
jgi:hypothetical protein